MQISDTSGGIREGIIMAFINVLIEGYARKLEHGFVASSTSCLITSGNTKIITDPGCNREKLLAALAREGLATKDIDFVFLSHCHPDHILLASIFENAKFVTFDSNFVYDRDILTTFDPHVMGSDVEIVDTQGHVFEHISLLVDTADGKVAVAGDVIWWLDDEKQVFRLDQPDHSQAKGMNMATLIESRKKLLARADWIIPGHGKMFKVNKSSFMNSQYD